MTGPTRKTIETLGRRLRDYRWRLYSGSIRCVGIDSTKHHSELTLCPLAMAVTHEGERIDKLIQDPEHGKLAEAVNTEHPDIRKHLSEDCPDAEPESLHREATLYAAAAVLHEGPRRAEIALILNIDPAIVEHLGHAADNPVCESGHALIQALDSPSNELRQEYEAHYGKLDAAGGQTQNRLRRHVQRPIAYRDR